MTSTAEKEFIEAIAEQVASCVDNAVELWMSEFESVLDDPHLTTLGRLQAMRAIVARYQQLRGHTDSPKPQTGCAAGRRVC